MIFSNRRIEERRVKVLYTALLNGERKVTNGEAKVDAIEYPGGIHLCLTMETRPTKEGGKGKKGSRREEEKHFRNSSYLRLVERH